MSSKSASKSSLRPSIPRVNARASKPRSGKARSASTVARAKPLPRPVAPQHNPSSTAKAKHQTPAEASLRALLASLAALVAAHGRRAHGADGMALWLALRALVALVEQHLAAPTSTRLVQHTAGPVVGLSLEQEPPAEPPVKALPPAPAPVPMTPEQQRARAAIDADLAIKGLAMTARELEHLGQHEPRAAQLAAGLRALLSPPTLAPAQRDLIPSALRIVQRHIDLKNDLAHLADALRYLKKEAPEGLRPMIERTASQVAKMQSEALEDEDTLACIASRVSGGPRGELTQHLVTLALLMRACGAHTDHDEAGDIERAHAAWNAAAD